MFYKKPLFLSHCEHPKGALQSHGSLTLLGMRVLMGALASPRNDI